jgi:NADH-quinone oxidoreductase subunit J
MNSLEIVFYFFVGLSGLSAALMTLTNNVFRAAFLLLICLVSIAGIYVSLQANLLAVVQLLVYAGGVVVLLSFGIMLSNRSKTGIIMSENHLVIPGILSGFGFFIYFLLNIRQGKIEFAKYSSTVKDIGEAFMTDYLLLFEVIGFLLLVVLIGASLFSATSSKHQLND